MNKKISRLETLIDRLQDIRKDYYVTVLYNNSNDFITDAIFYVIILSPDVLDYNVNINENIHEIVKNQLVLKIYPIFPSVGLIMIHNVAGPSERRKTMKELLVMEIVFSMPALLPCAEMKVSGHL